MLFASLLLAASIPLQADRRLDSIARAAARVEIARAESTATLSRGRDAAEQQVRILQSALQRATSDSSSLGVFVAALGVLFGVGASTSGFLIWRQGSDYRAQRALEKKEHDARLS